MVRILIYAGFNHFSYEWNRWLCSQIIERRFLDYMRVTNRKQRGLCVWAAWRTVALFCANCNRIVRTLNTKDSPEIYGNVILEGEKVHVNVPVQKVFVVHHGTFFLSGPRGSRKRDYVDRFESFNRLTYTGSRTLSLEQQQSNVQPRRPILIGSSARKEYFSNLSYLTFHVIVDAAVRTNPCHSAVCTYVNISRCPYCYNRCGIAQCWNAQKLKKEKYRDDQWSDLSTVDHCTMKFNSFRCVAAPRKSSAQTLLG